MEPNDTGTPQTSRSLGWQLLAGIGIGAAIMYFLDPDRGGRRRALVRDQAASLLRQGTRELRDRATDVSNRVRGTAAELRNRDEETPEDDVLTARIRAELGHHVEHSRAIEIFAENGRVTLRGPVLRDEMDDVLSTVRKVRGVESVNNELRVHETAGSEPSLQSNV